MKLTRHEKERVADSRRKIQSVTETLSQVDPAKIPQIDEIEDCLEDAEKTLNEALQKE